MGTSNEGDTVYGLLTQTWWSVSVRAAVAIALGAVLLALPRLPLATVALAFGCFAAVDGTVAIVAALRGRRQDGLALVLDGCAGMVVSLVAAAWPGITTIGLLALAVAWATLRGGAQLYAASALRRHCPREHSLWLAALAVLVAAVVLATHPQDTARDVERVLGATTVASGALLAMLAGRLWTFRRRSRRLRRIFITSDVSPGEQRAA